MSDSKQFCGTSTYVYAICSSEQPFDSNSINSSILLQLLFTLDKKKKAHLTRNVSLRTCIQSLSRKTQLWVYRAGTQVWFRCFSGLVNIEFFLQLCKTLSRNQRKKVALKFLCTLPCLYQFISKRYLHKYHFIYYLSIIIIYQYIYYIIIIYRYIYYLSIIYQ